VQAGLLYSGGILLLTPILASQAFTSHCQPETQR
jgi:hypothetical protein